MVGNLLLLLLGALVVAFFAIQNIGAGDFMLAGTHQRQFDLILDVFDMESATVGLAANQRTDDIAGEVFHHVTDARAGGCLTAVDGDERLGQCNGDFVRLEGDHGAVAADDLVVGVGGGGRGIRAQHVVDQNGVDGGLKIGGNLHR